MRPPLQAVPMRLISRHLNSNRTEDNDDSILQLPPGLVATPLTRFLFRPTLSRP